MAGCINNIRIASYRILVLALFIVVFTSCASLPKFYWPEHEKALELQMTTEPNCTLMSIEYCQHLQENGYETRMICGNILGFDERHCWVEVWNEDLGKWYLLDLAFDSGGYPIEYYSERTNRRIYNCGD